MDHKVASGTTVLTIESVRKSQIKGEVKTACGMKLIVTYLVQTFRALAISLPQLWPEFA